MQINKIETIYFPSIYGDFILTAYSVEDESQPFMKYVFTLYTKNFEELKVPYVRIHSACNLSEALGSLRCDCRMQLEQSLKIIDKKGGIFVYLDQEGRGHGIFNKIKELNLQDKGLDTVEASLRLGLDADNRDYQVVAQILKDLKKTKIYLMTNNPDKIKSLSKFGIEIAERIAIETEPNQFNYKYLETKKIKMGHLLDKYIK